MSFIKTHSNIIWWNFLNQFTIPFYIHLNLKTCTHLVWIQNIPITWNPLPLSLCQLKYFLSSELFWRIYIFSYSSTPPVRLPTKVVPKQRLSNGHIYSSSTKHHILIIKSRDHSNSFITLKKKTLSYYSTLWAHSFS